MPLTIVPPKPGRTPNYHIRGTYLGVPVNRSAGTPDRRSKLKKRIEQEIESGIRTPSCGPTFLAAAVAYMKAGGERTFLGPIIEYDGVYAICDKAVETIVQHDLDHIANALYPNNTPQSRNREVYTPVIAVGPASTGASSGPRAGRVRNPNRFSNMIRRSTCSMLPTPSTANLDCCAIRCSIPGGASGTCSTRTPDCAISTWITARST